VSKASERRLQQAALVPLLTNQRMGKEKLLGGALMPPLTCKSTREDYYVRYAAEYLGRDRKTQAILCGNMFLPIGSTFMSAARSAPSSHPTCCATWPSTVRRSCANACFKHSKQWKLKQTADKADWLIGAGLLAKGVNGVAIRSMKAPGTAYDDPRLGKDPQPAHMKDYFKGSADNGGVHINSGIPNHAFYLVASALGGNAWDRAGRIWYDTLTDMIGPNTTFKQAANATVRSAGNLFGSGSKEQKAVTSAWKQVGVIK
jgi:hypothetical protein